MQIRYSKINKDDAKQIAILHKKVFNDILSYQNINSLETYYKELIQLCNLSQKATYDNRIVGYLIFSNENPFGTLIKTSYFNFIKTSLKYFLSNKKEILFLVATFIPLRNTSKLWSSHILLLTKSFRDLTLKLAQI